MLGSDPLCAFSLYPALMGRRHSLHHRATQCGNHGRLVCAVDPACGSAKPADAWPGPPKFSTLIPSVFGIMELAFAELLWNQALLVKDGTTNILRTSFTRVFFLTISAYIVEPCERGAQVLGDPANRFHAVDCGVGAAKILSIIDVPG